MLRDKPTKTGIKTLVRRAYKNRYDFDSVRIDSNGDITGYYKSLSSRGTPLGNISECFTTRTESMNVRLYNRPNNLVFTFAYDV